MITHYDLFAGIGGFSLALDEVFKGEPIRHVFCEWEQFPTAVLKKHWPEAIYYGDISDLVADSECQGRKGCGGKDTGRCRQLGGEVQETNGEVPQRYDHAELSDTDRHITANNGRTGLEKERPEQQPTGSRREDSHAQDPISERSRGGAKVTDKYWNAKAPKFKTRDQVGRIGHETGVKLRLQPAMTQWMMGFPESWTEFPTQEPNGEKKASKPTETP